MRPLNARAGPTHRSMRPAVRHRVRRASHRRNRPNPRGGLVGSSPRLVQGLRGASGPDAARSGRPVGSEPRVEVEAHRGPPPVRAANPAHASAFDAGNRRRKRESDCASCGQSRWCSREHAQRFRRWSRCSTFGLETRPGQDRAKRGVDACDLWIYRGLSDYKSDVPGRRDCRCHRAFLV